MKPRPYQLETTAKVRQRLEQNPLARVCVHGPTGCGKSFMMADLLSDPVPQMAVTHRRVLLDQLSASLTNAGVEHGIRASGYAPNHSARVQLSMIQSDFVRSIKGDRWQLHDGCRRIHIDELHAVKGNMAEAILAAYPAAAVIGWTASPREVSHICDQLVVAATVDDLIEDGYLVPPVVYTPDGPSLKCLAALKRNTGGEFSPSDVAKVMKPKMVVGRVIEWYRKLNPLGVPAALFAPGVKQSIWFAQQLTLSGIPAAHIDAKNVWMPDGRTLDSSSEVRADLFAALTSGEIKVLCNRFVLREGWDCPIVGHIILATAFGARTSFVQACGRGLRPAPGKTHCTFQDHGANFWRHPALDDPTPWDMAKLERHEANTRADKLRSGELPEPICCPECSCLRASGPICPNCGFRHALSVRYVMQTSGRLVKQEGRLFKERHTVRTDTCEADWKRSFWAARKNRPQASLRQVYAWHSRKHDWQSPPLDLPLMPKDGREQLWNYRIGSIPLTELRS